MNFFRRRRKKATNETFKTKDEALIHQLYDVLKKHGDAILRGRTKLSLTVPIIIVMNGHFKKITEGINETCFQVTSYDESHGNLHQLIPFIFDFVQKVISAKISSGAVNLNCPLLNLEYFKALQYLEIRRIEISSIKGLSLIRRQLKGFVCYHGTDSIRAIVSAFGRNEEDLQALSSLDTLKVDCNQISTLNDEAFTCFPVLKSLDVSYNIIKNADCKILPPLKHLNLACNKIPNIPLFPHHASQSLTTLILRNNNLVSLEGIQNLNSLEYLDVSRNCIVEFKDIFPLALLGKLSNLTMTENPISYKPEYRFRVIRSLSPITRHTKIIFDGIQLTASELCHLGGNVQPVSLTEYISDNREDCSSPGNRSGSRVVSQSGSRVGSRSGSRVGSRSASLVGSLNGTPIQGSLRGSLDDLPSFATPGRTVTRRRNEGKKVRNAVIADPGAKPSLPNFSSSLGVQQRDYDYDGWVEKESSQVEEQALDTTSDITALTNGNNKDSRKNDDKMVNDTAPELENSITNQTLMSVQSDEYENHESVEEQANYPNDDEISVISDSRDEFAYLVESTSKRVKDDDFLSADFENIFLIFKPPYLIEKSDLGKMKTRLDLDYLQNMELQTTTTTSNEEGITTETDGNNELRVILQFDLVRMDCQYREYRFTEQEQFDSFVATLQPIFVKNRQKKLAETMQYCECLRCGLVFYHRQQNSLEIITCANQDCGSNLVIEKKINEIDVIDQQDELIEAYEDEENQSDVNYNGDVVDGDEHYNSSHDYTLATTKLNDSSIAIVIPSFKDIGEKAKISSWPRYISIREPYKSENRCCRSFPNDELYQKFYKESVVENIISNETNLSRNKLIEKTSDEVSLMESNLNDNNNATIDVNFYSRIKQSSYKSSTETASVMSIGSSSQAPQSRSHSRPQSKVSGRTRTPRSNMSTPVTSAKVSLFSQIKDHMRCDHRLKLFLSMKVFSDQSEEFLCQIKCCFVGYEKPNIYQGLLVVTNCSLHVFVITDVDSDIPEECLKHVASCSINDWKFLMCGYFSQSFIIDSSKTNFRYKFLVCDTTTTNKFFLILEDLIQTKLKFKFDPPLILREPNPQTLSDIRIQAFGLVESISERATRLHEQIVHYSHPPLLKNKKMRIRTHQNCFVAKEFVQWLCARKEVDSKEQGVQLGQQLLDGGVITIVSKEQRFKDDDAVYKFSQLLESKTATSPTNNHSINNNENMDDDNEEIDTFIQTYSILQCRLQDEESSKFDVFTIILTNSHIFLTDECHQWPLSNLRPPPSQLRRRYEKIDSNRITNITAIDFYEDAPCYASIYFVNENSLDDNGETNWLIKFETTEELKKLTGNIRRTWEDSFAVELTVLTQPTIMPVLDSYILV